MLSFMKPFLIFRFKDLNNSDLYSSILYYTNKDELIERMQSHSIDILITDNPSVHNLNRLDELMQLRSAVIIFDLANEIDVERRKESYYHKIEPHLRRHRYELINETEIEGIKVYEWNRGIEQRFLDIVVPGIKSERTYMLLAAMITEHDTVLLDTHFIPELIQYGAVYKRNIIAAVKFEQSLVNYLTKWFEEKETVKEEPKVTLATGQYELTF